MDLVVIESPFAPPKDDPRPDITLQRNATYVRAAMRVAFMEGLAPYASHALYTLPGVLDDTNPDERRLGMRAGFSWGRLAPFRWVMEDYGISSGMQSGIDEAKKHNQGIIRKTLPGFPERWLRSVALFDVMVETLSSPILPPVLMNLSDDDFDSIETWSEDTDQPLPGFILNWNKLPEKPLSFGRPSPARTKTL